MGNKAQVFHGARAKVYVDGTLVGIFNSVSWGYNLSIDPAFVLGRFSAADLGYTAADVVRIDCSGWRVVGKGPHSTVGQGNKLVPTLDQLLQHEDMMFVIEDRQAGGLGTGGLKGDAPPPIMEVIGVRSAGYHTAVNAKQLQEMTLPFVGLRVSDESGPNDESSDAATLDIVG